MCYHTGMITVYILFHVAREHWTGYSLDIYDVAETLP